MIKVLNWITKEPFYRVGIYSVASFAAIAIGEGSLYWIGGLNTVLLLFFLGYAKWFKF